jgi:hypothetical protein
VNSKSFNHKFGLPGKRQPLNETFKGTEHLGMFAGHGKSIGAICNPADFSGVVEVGPGCWGPRTVGLPLTWSSQIASRWTSQPSTPGS